MASRRRVALRWASGTAVCALLFGVLAGCTPTDSPPGPATTTTLAPGTNTTPRGDDQVRLNQIQLIGSHNSYHVAPPTAILDLLRWAASVAPDVATHLGDPGSLDYTHATIDQQLLRGIRTFELDIYADPTGGRFASPILLGLVGGSDPLLPPGLDRPGFKILHIADIDWRSRCSSLDVCLAIMRQWSDAHPGHLPVVINLELKGSGLPAPFTGTPVLPFDAARLDAVDAALRSGLGDKLLTPDDVRGTAPDLRAAVTTTGWPTVRDSRGRFLVFMDNDDTRAEYLAGHPGLAGRAMFTSSGDGQPDGAILKLNEPGDGSEIASRVADGYLVRTRADADLIEAWHDDTARRDVTFASGAQVIHTDFPPGEPYAPNGYEVSFGTPVAARCNPANTTAATCTPDALVEPLP